TAIQLCTKRGPPLTPGSDEFSCAPGFAVTGLSLPAGVIMGENHRFVPTTEPGVASDVSARFTAERAVHVGSNYIVLPYVLYEDDGVTPMVLHNGDPVVYSAGGGTPIGGLVDGATYYFFTANPADPVNLSHVQLVRTKCEATGKKEDCNTQADIARGNTVDYTSTRSC